ncbi:MAG: diguanylate cyclase [Eubacteriales bacterium]|nr:diguanylate cyclase [Eubacteriales bacterium]MDN5364559.1 diguanylate cyclase [Eubacteriales bacterium]
MNNLNMFNRNLWIITGVASIPFAVFAFIDPSKVVFPDIFYLFVFASIYNGLIVPFGVFRGELTWWKKTLAIGVNLLIVTLWIHYTGDDESIFYPTFYFLPIIAATMFCGFLDSILTATAASLLALYFKYDPRVGLGLNILADAKLLVQIVLFYIMASAIGYRFKGEKEQQLLNQRITSELEAAYKQLSSSHKQLQNYTEIIERMNREIEQLAITDELTNLYNYRYFQVTLDKELKRNRYSTVALLMLDIDKFKQFNDRYGHLMGNKLLIEIGKIIKNNVRPVDTVARYGGEEFAVIMPATDAEEAYQLAERIRRAVEVMAFPVGETETANVTISVGIATYPGGAGNKSELISHADLALDEAKQSGGNRTVIYRGKKEEMAR